MAYITQRIKTQPFFFIVFPFFALIKKRRKICRRNISQTEVVTIWKEKEIEKEKKKERNRKRKILKKKFKK